MKKILIFYIILTIMMTIAFMIPNNSQKNNKYEVTENEIEEYKKEARQLLPDFTEEQINESARIYFEQKEFAYKLKNESNMGFFKALKTSAIISAIMIGGFKLYFFIKECHFNELYGESQNGEMGNIFRNFFGKMRW